MKSHSKEDKMRYIIRILLITALTASTTTSVFASWKDSSYNYNNSSQNYKNSSYNYNNSPSNYNNSASNYNSTNSTYSTQGTRIGYTTEKAGGGYNYYNNSGKRTGYSN